MNGTISDLHTGLKLTWLTSRLIAVAGTLSLTAYAQSVLPGSDTTSASASMLSRNAIVPLTVIDHFFPELTQEASTGHNLTAVGNTKATRSVIYTNSDNSQKLTISLDQYASASDASSAYEEAVQRSKTVPGFKPISASNLGQNAFIGTVTQGEETHIGIGALHGAIIVSATLAGYDPTSDNIAKLLSLAREEQAVAKAALDRTTHR